MHLVAGRRWKVALATVLSGAALPACAVEDRQYGFGYNGQYQSSQPQQRQYAPAQNTYQQTYNNDSNYYYKQQYDYNRQQSNGAQQYNYGSKPSGFPGEQRSDTGQPRRVDGDENRSRRRHHRHRVSNYDWSDGDRPRNRRDWSDGDRPRNRRDWSDGDQPRRNGRVSTTLSGKGWWAGTGGWFAYGQIAMCVRTCDGYFFPMGQVNDPSSLDAQKSLCTALCPDAKTDLYFLPQGADGITTAVTRDGHPYSRMPTALRYTKTHDAACTCHGKTPQSHLVALLKDITLRRGDAVMTVNGVLVFNGAFRWPYRLADFQILDKARYYLRNALALAALEKAAMHVQSATKGSKVAKDKPGVAPVPATFITDNSGKTVRLVGQALSYAPPSQPTQDPSKADIDTAQTQDKPGEKATR